LEVQVYRSSYMANPASSDEDLDSSNSKKPPHFMLVTERKRWETERMEVGRPLSTAPTSSVCGTCSSRTPRRPALLLPRLLRKQKIQDKLEESPGRNG
jgi:hypothetical protein